MSETIATALERAARLFGDHEAVVDGDVRWTYRELHRRVAALDATLDDLGLATGDVVAVLGANSAAHMVAWLGVPRSGRLLCELNVRLAAPELEFIARDAGVRALLVDDAFADAGLALADVCEEIDHVVQLGGDALTERPGRPPAVVDPDQVAGIFYTGGTTGRPKGAMLTHRNLVANAKHTLISLGYDEGDSYLHAAPMFHIADANANLSLTWVGGRHVIVPEFDPATWLATVEAERVTQAVLVPTMVAAIVDHPAIGDHDLSSLAQVIYAGSPMPEDLLLRAMDALPCDWTQCYGMTEAAPLVTHLSPAEHRRGGALLRSAGRPIVGVGAEIRRPDGGVADTGETSEIWVRGPNVMS